VIGAAAANDAPLDPVPGASNSLVSAAGARASGASGVRVAGASDARVATVRGEAMLEMPLDLYIPPDALEVFFDTFEGPLDLLLYLIRKANIDILDIPMARLTEQYLEYVELMRRRNLELAAEYLLMAALLMEIKSRMLLPRPRALREDEEDPRAELVRRLMEYESIKLAAHKLDALPVLGRDFLTVEVWIEQAAGQRLPQVRTQDLIAAWQSLLMRARVTQHHKVTREELSVREFMSSILRRLHGGQFTDFTSLFEIGKGVAVVVVSFLALLELVRESLIEVTQSEPYAPIYVKLAHAESE
jgi:segregation and condensation protein A